MADSACCGRRAGDGDQRRPDRAAVEVSATAEFALEGALAGLVAGLDLFGVVVVGMVTESAGGIIRDVLIGDVPPVAVRQQRYLLAALAASTVALTLVGLVGEAAAWLLTGLDAAGLALFAVGGGTVRDVLLGEVPAILRIDVSAVAALLGAVVVVIARRAGAPSWAAMTAGAACCSVLRIAAAGGDWQLPAPGR